MGAAKKKPTSENILRTVSEMIGQRTGEAPEQVVERIVRRAETAQRLERPSSQRATKRSAFTPSASEKVAAKPRT